MAWDNLQLDILADIVDAGVVTVNGGDARVADLEATGFVTTTGGGARSVVAKHRPAGLAEAVKGMLATKASWTYSELMAALGFTSVTDMLSAGQVAASLGYHRTGRHREFLSRTPRRVRNNARGHSLGLEGAKRMHARSAEGATRKQLVAEFKVGMSCVERTLSGRTWPEAKPS